MTKWIEYKWMIDETLAIMSVNDDFSGASDDDIKCMELFDRNMINNHNSALWCITGKETNFERCEATNLMSDCIEITLLKKG